MSDGITDMMRGMKIRSAKIHLELSCNCSDEEFKEWLESALGQRDNISAYFLLPYGLSDCEININYET